MAEIVNMYNPYDVGGATAVIASVTMKVWNWTPGLKDVNEGIIFITGLLGLIYLVVKIRGGLLDNKIKKKKLKDGSDSK